MNIWNCISIWILGYFNFFSTWYWIAKIAWISRYSDIQVSGYHIPNGPLPHLELQAYFTGMSGILFLRENITFVLQKIDIFWHGLSEYLPNLLDSEFFTYISNIKFSRFLLCVSTYFATIQFAKRAFPFVLSNNQDM